jgi:gamma-glutamyltranspeptidase/glutathione hydrolase
MRQLLLLAAAAAAVPPVLCARAPQYARKAMVVAREVHAAEAGAAVLRAGGNAVDAAVTIGFALAVTHPSAGNLGGGGFLLARFADGRATFIDFRERAPLRASRDMYLDDQGGLTAASVTGYLAAGVPGTVRGLEFAHQKYGRKPWAELLRPAVELAESGFEVSFDLARSLRSKCDLLGEFPESRRIFLNGGLYYEPGDRLLQKDLARTLRRIQTEGSKDFYEGETARRLAADMSAHGGLVTLEDLQQYRVEERRPLAGSYRGFGILTAPPPSSGGVGILQMLGILEPTGYEKSGAGSAASLHMLAEAMRRYFADRSEHLGDPDFVNVPVQTLLSPEYIAARRATIDPDKATPSAAIAPGKPGPEQGANTTHYTIADAEGNVVAVTYTLNGGFGSGVTAAGLGFLLNNEMDDFAVKPGRPNMYGVVQGERNAVAPRRHPLSSMAPTIVTRDGRFWFALGSPGGPTIINTVLEVLVNVIDFKMNIQDAVDWPRIHHQWLPDELRLERGRFSPDTIALLEKRGHRIRFSDTQGEVAAVLSEGGWLQGAADGRVESAAIGY